MSVKSGIDFWTLYFVCERSFWTHCILCVNVVLDTLYNPNKTQNIILKIKDLQLQEER